MKKLLIPLFVLALLSLSPLMGISQAYALGEACPSGADGDCPGSEVCDTSNHLCVASDDAGEGGGNVATGGKCLLDGDCSGNLACIHNVCQIDPSLEDTGTAAVGGSCTNNTQCPGDLTCQIPAGQAQGTCQAATGNAAAAPQSAAVNNCDAGGGFITLSCIPGLKGVASASGLQTFFQTLYELCIGIACIIAVLQISRAGFMYMTAQGNASQHQEAKHLIAMSLIGLALILSPVIVFNFINPNINSFKFLTDDANSLTVQQGQSQLPNTPGTGPGRSNTASSSSSEPVAGCTSPINGPYAKKAICKDSTSAGNYVAGCDSIGLDGLQQGCVRDSQNECVKDYVVYCVKKATFTHYQEKEGTLGLYKEMGIIPKQLPQATSFQNMCTDGGGTVIKQSDSFWNFNPLEITCPADAGFQITPPYTQARCSDDNWQCSPGL